MQYQPDNDGENHQRIIVPFTRKLSDDKGIPPIQHRCRECVVVTARIHGRVDECRNQRARQQHEAFQREDGRGHTHVDAADRRLNGHPDRTVRRNSVHRPPPVERQPRAERRCADLPRCVGIRIQPKLPQGAIRQIAENIN